MGFWKNGVRTGRLPRGGGGADGIASGESEKKMELDSRTRDRGGGEANGGAAVWGKGDRERGPRQAKQRKRELKAWPRSLVLPRALGTRPLSQVTLARAVSGALWGLAVLG